MYYLGLDLSSAETGYAIVNEEEKLIAFGSISLSKYKKKKFPLEYVKVLYDELNKIAIEYKPDICMIEATFSRNVRTAKSLSRVRGICEIAMINAGIKNIVEINPTAARKKVFGNGKLTKEEVYSQLIRKYPDKNFFSKGLDISDAICIALSVIKKGPL